MITAVGESDARLVTAARQDRAAFVALYQRYLPRVYRYVYRRVGNRQDAEDVTASVFTEALESLDRPGGTGLLRPAWRSGRTSRR